MKGLRWVCAPLAIVALMRAASVFPQAGLHVLLDPGAIGEVTTTSWPTFNGDYTGQRYSSATQIDAENVKRITQRWVYKITDQMGMGDQGAELNLAASYSMLLAQQTTLGMQAVRLKSHIRDRQQRHDLQVAIDHIGVAIGYFDQLTGDLFGTVSEKTLHSIRRVA